MSPTSTGTSPQTPGPPPGLQLWVAVNQHTDVDRAPYREQHRDYMQQLTDDEVIFATGPTYLTHGAEVTGGITILRVADRAHAQRILDNEPYVRAGARTYELIAWDVQRGNYAESQ